MEYASTDPLATNPPIVLIHGLWLTPRSWEHWKERYERRGYEVITPAYPGLEVEVEALREDPSPIANLTVPDPRPPRVDHPRARPTAERVAHQERRPVELADDLSRWARVSPTLAFAIGDGSSRSASTSTSRPG